MSIFNLSSKLYTTTHLCGPSLNYREFIHILMTNLFSFSTRATRMQTMIIRINSKLPRPSQITSLSVRLMSLPSRLPIEAQTFTTIILRTWVLLNSRNLNFYELFNFTLKNIMKTLHEFWSATSLTFNPCNNFEIHFVVFDTKKIVKKLI